MDNKYYTPEIEEFHVGFEYESNVEDFNVWEKNIFQENEFSFNIKSLKNQIKKHVRVKHLDQEDIEDLLIPLGFYKCPNPYSGCTYITGSYLDEKALHVSLIENSNEVHVVRYNEFKQSDGYNYTHKYLFLGCLKNKSELKRILKHLILFNMSSTLYYKIIKPIEDKYLSDDLKHILKEKFDILPGEEVRLDTTNLDYLKGLSDASIDGAKTLVDIIEKYDAVAIWIR